MNLLLEDSSPEKVPILLEDLITTLAESDRIELKQEDIFFLLIVILMVENDFVPVLNNGVEWEQHNSIDKEQLCYWKRTGSYEVTFLMSSFKDIPLKLILCPLGTTMSINLLINYDSTDVYSVMLPHIKYVVAPKAPTIPMIFNDLRDLCYKYKDKIIVPVKSRILSYYGFPSASLLGLPAEVFIYLLLYLPLKDILNLSETCKRIRYIIETDNFWHKLYIRDFDTSSEKDDSSWKTLYIAKYQEEQDKKLKACRLTGGLNSMLPISRFGAHLDHPYLWALLFD
ncbi:uncharacterized protein LOC121731749 [Aricia agestis]|uniref:uncharacterized protein LOC121731749 n=1 Tax=Aricia agestis TaxID=91739 RepID=UPI001C204099|nr:uncharacterized protein LOC121731749 [Aricia agestis]